MVSLRRDFLMLFELLPEIVEINFDTDNSSLYALENLFSATASGAHAICAERETLTKIIEILNRDGSPFSKRSRSTVQYIQKNYATQKGTFDKATFKIQLGKGEAVQQISADIWRIPLKKLSDLSVVGKARLLAENLSDCALYTFSAKHFAEKNKLININLAIDPIGGGGSTIHPQFEQNKQQSTFCLCITDSDKFSPESPNSEISSRCSSLIDSSTWMLKHLTIEGRDIENIFPLGIVNATLNDLENGDEPRLRWEILKVTLSKLTHKNTYLYIDLKNGVTRGWVDRLSNQRDVLFWQSVKTDFENNRLPNSSMGKLLCSECEKLPDLDLMDRSCTDCKIITGICRDLAAHVLHWLDARTYQKSAEMVSSSNDENWLKVGEYVFWFSFAQKVKRL